MYNLPSYQNCHGRIRSFFKKHQKLILPFPVHLTDVRFYLPLSNDGLELEDKRKAGAAYPTHVDSTTI